MPRAKSKEQIKLDNSFRFTDPHQIEEAAYYKWLSRGRQGGDPMEDWLEAELELQSNLYSEDDDVERSLISSVPQKTGLSTIHQLYMASQQDKT
jgi:hypothetical protein